LTQHLVLAKKTDKEMEFAAAQIRALAQSADKAGRQEILSTLSKLQSELEDPMETLMRLSNFVGTTFPEF
jgi:hypothetical protein